MKNMIRLATMKDWSRIVLLYEDAIKAPGFTNGDFWHGDYPFNELENDILNKALYIIENDDDIICGFSAYEYIYEEPFYDWENKNAPHLYIERLVVNHNYKHQGYGKRILTMMGELCKEHGYEYLRLCVVSSNQLAINVYTKVGFKLVEGQCDQPCLNGTHMKAMEMKVK